MRIFQVKIELTYMFFVFSLFLMLGCGTIFGLTRSNSTRTEFKQFVQSGERTVLEMFIN